MRKDFGCVMGAVGCIAACASSGDAFATTIDIIDPYVNLFNVSSNTNGFSSGEFIRFGADSVTPNGNSGTSGVATTIDTSTGATFSRHLTFNPGVTDPNFYTRLTPYSSSLTGAYTLKFTNGNVTASATVAALPPGTQEAPFVNSITISGSGSTPTFSWSPPPHAQVDGYRVNIYDKNLLNVAGEPTEVFSQNYLPSVRSFTVPSANKYISQGGRYSIEISLLQTRDGSSSNLANGNLKAISRVYSDFTPLTQGSPVVNLPVTLAGGAYQYNLTVAASQVYYLDPALAIGYSYQTGAGNPNFQSVILPELQPFYDLIYSYGGMKYDKTIAAAMRYFFPSGGVSAFDIEGISAFNPSNPPAFTAGVSFVSDGNFTGLQTPLLRVSAVPLPASAPLFGGAFFAFGAAGYILKRIGSLRARPHRSAPC